MEQLGQQLGGIVFLFAGQGCQQLGMAERLRQVDAHFDHWLTWLDRHASLLLGRSVLEAFGEGAAEENLSTVELSHPAIYMVELAAAQTLCARGVRPSVVLGCSLGEWAAGAVSGAMHPLVGLDAVVAHARAVRDHTPPGGMLAVLGEVTPAQRAGCSVAVVNGASHHVLAGSLGPLDRVERELTHSGGVCARLPVRHAFHDPAIDAAESPFARATATLPFGFPSRSILFSSATLDAVDELSAEHLWKAGRAQVRLGEAIQRVERDYRPLAYVDVSPMGTLATVVRRALPRDRARKVHTIFSPFAESKSAVSGIAEALV